MEVFLGFLVGLLGSMHCLGMCGPLALAVPHSDNGKLHAVIDDLLYNGGRIFTYIILGMIVGAFGSSIKLAGYQEVLSLTIGILILLTVLLPGKIRKSILENSFFEKISIKFRFFFNKAMQSNTKLSLLVLGLLNGLLPCGLVYVALATASVFAQPLRSGTYMLFFGLGTLPVMFTIFMVRKLIKLNFRQKLLKLVPFGVAVIACLLILRGMSLGIPYISPVLPDKIEKKHDCCK